MHLEEVQKRPRRNKINRALLNPKFHAEAYNHRNLISLHLTISSIVMIKAGTAKMNSGIGKDAAMMMSIKMAGVLSVAACMVISITANIQYYLTHYHQVC